MTRVDVAIVGAGAAGLGCARELVARGRRVVVIEALPRVGGRAWTVDLLGQPVDQGAQFVHAFQHGNPWAEIAWGRGARLRVVPQERRAPGLDSAAIAHRYATALARIAAAPAGASVADALDPDDRLGRAYAGPWLMGFEPEALDAADLAESFGGDDGLVPDGYGTLVAAMAADLPIRLGVPVVAIDERTDQVELTTPEGRIEAAQAVITASTAALAQGIIRFTPPLPAAVSAALDDLPLGNLVKVSLRLEDGALPHRDGCFLLPDAPSLATPLLHLRPAGRPIVTTFIGGRAGDAVDAIDERDAVAHATDQLVALCGSSARGAVRGGTVSRWRGIRSIAGSYTGARPGRLAARAVLREPWSARLHYAGEACAPPGWQATVAGAWLAGRAVARRIAGG